MHILAKKALLFLHRRKKGKAQTRVTALLGPLPPKPTSSFLVHLCFLYLFPEAALSPSPPSGGWGRAVQSAPGAFPESGTDWGLGPSSVPLNLENRYKISETGAQRKTPRITGQDMS